MARGSKQQTTAGRAGGIRGLFRAIAKALTPRGLAPQPTKSRRRRGETDGDFRRAAAIPHRLRAGFRAARIVIGLRKPSRPIARARASSPAEAFPWQEVFGPPDPCAPFDPSWPCSAGDAGFDDVFADAMPPANAPSPNL
jgi:hypothetical protein